MSRRAKIAGLAVSALVVAALLVRVRGALSPFFLGAAIAYLCHPWVNKLEERQVPRALAIGLVYAAFGVFAVLLAYAVLPSLVQEFEAVLAALAERTKRLEGVTQSALGDIQRLSLPMAVEELQAAAIRRVEAALERLAARTADFIVGFVSHLFTIVLSPFLAYYILRDARALRRTLIAWLPQHVRAHALELARRVNRVVSGFVRGQLIVSAVVAAATAAGLSALGVRYAVFLGTVAGLADLIPYFGPFIGAVPAVAAALLDSPAKALWTLGLMVAIQQLEGMALGPKIVGHQVGLHPLTVIFSVLAGAELLGVVGMLTAVPVAGAVKAIVGYVGDQILERTS